MSLKYDPRYCSGKRLAHLNRVHKKNHNRTRGHREARTPLLVAKASARNDRDLREYTHNRKGRNPYK